jgi:beta-mannosidase
VLNVELDAGWTLRAIGGDSEARVPETYPGAVPGCVHTDLMAAGVIPDPYLDGNEEALRWMHDIDWRYATTLDPGSLGDDPSADDAERVDLVFDGIDTVATIRLRNGNETIELGRTFNMHRSYRFDITPQLRGRPLTLEVDLRSATAFAAEEEQRLGQRPKAYSAPYNVVRKMACSFGWDWGPDLRTAGLWKPVRVERWSTARLAQVRPLITVDDSGTGRVELHVELERLDPDTPLTLRAVVLDQVAELTVQPGARSAVVVVEVPDAPLWWPVGYGDQPLADLTLVLSAADRELDSWQRRVGFRTVSLDTSGDEFGSRFTLAVNGRPVFAKGVNWIPDDHFITRITAERLSRRLDQAVQAHVNLIRVWGGGIYETEDFYSACDERGLLVWQDFLLACAAYPEESPLWQEIEAEARENVVRLSAHPSLALYNGGNENLWGHESWGWKERLDGRTWGARYAYELFPRIVAELDPTRPYSENSPSSPGYDLSQVHPNDADHGSHHQWEVWNQIDYSAYRGEIPRFCSEFGFQAPPAWRTLIDWVHDVDGAPLNDASDPKNDANFLLHQKAADGNGKLDRGLAPHLGVPEDFADWHWATQLNQARAVSYAIDHYRRWWPRTAGAVVWQLNDCWPVTSWAAIDSLGRRKPLWYALRRAFAPHNLVFVSENDRLSVAVLNDTDEPWRGEITLTRERFDGENVAQASVPVDVGPRSSVPLPVPDEVASVADPRTEVVTAQLNECTAVHAFAEDLELALDPEPLQVDVERVADGYAVTVTARALARDVMLHPDRVAPDGSVDEALVTLRAGEQATFHVRTQSSGLEQALAGYPALRTANDLQRR